MCKLKYLVLYFIEKYDAFFLISYLIQQTFKHKYLTFKTNPTKWL